MYISVVGGRSEKKYGLRLRGGRVHVCGRGRGRGAGKRI